MSRLSPSTCDLKTCRERIIQVNVSYLVVAYANCAALEMCRVAICIGSRQVSTLPSLIVGGLINLGWGVRGLSDIGDLGWGWVLKIEVGEYL